MANEGVMIRLRTSCFGISLGEYRMLKRVVVYLARDRLYWYHDSWWGNGSPSPVRLGGSKESTSPSELRYGPNTFVAAVENLGQWAKA